MKSGFTFIKMFGTKHISSNDRNSKLVYTYRFHDPFFVVTLFPNLSQDSDVLRQYIRRGYEAKLMLTVFNYESVQIFPQSVLPSDLKRSREMIELLLFMERFETHRFHVFAPSTDPVVGF